MPLIDLVTVLRWWLAVSIVGVILLPLAANIFTPFFDRGYIFAKILGILLVSYLVWLLASLHIVTFSATTVYLACGVLLIVTLVALYGRGTIQALFPSWKVFLFEEAMFLAALFFLVWVRGHEPSIHGLEKYMDFGFINSILRSDYFPPKDLWLTPLTINYYYFGHVATAVLTKLSGLDAAITYNLMLSTVFALSFTAAFSLGATLSCYPLSELKIYDKLYAVAAGLLTAYLVTLAGNLHTIYLFTTGYANEAPRPFWEIFSGFHPDSYWYPSATRFIPFTIHEFPSYSWVVADLHGHVLDIPFVLLIIALFWVVFIKGVSWLKGFLLSLVLAVLYMTNALDGLIYAGMLVLLCAVLFWQTKRRFWLLIPLLVIIGAVVLSLPFHLNFKPFAASILPVRDHTPPWMLFVLWGFFYYLVAGFVAAIDIAYRKTGKWQLTAADMFTMLLIVVSTGLIIFPELFYFKDIYPTHYRANTMFKLGYQAFIMLSIAAAFIIFRVTISAKSMSVKLIVGSYWFVALLGFLLVSVYPYFSTRSYYNGLKNYQGLDGLAYFRQLYPADYDALFWLRQNVAGQPVIAEAAGESYTDFARISANTGLPTMVGWPVHEWLWRGSVDETTKQAADVERLYNTNSAEEAHTIITKYSVSYVFVGALEHQKYTNLQEQKFRELGTLVFASGETRIYEVKK